MSATPIQATRNKIARLYAAGILVFAGAVGGVTLLGLFLSLLTFR